ncbi:TPA: hypothetical protein ACH3X1_010211 [Trebouxia sp. C0004]
MVRFLDAVKNIIALLSVGLLKMTYDLWQPSLSGLGMSQCYGTDLCVGNGCNSGWQAQTRRSRAQAQAVQRGGRKCLFPVTCLHQHCHNVDRHRAVRSSGYSRVQACSIWHREKKRLD